MNVTKSRLHDHALLNDYQTASMEGHHLGPFKGNGLVNVHQQDKLYLNPSFHATQFTAATKLSTSYQGSHPLLA
jgi:hypothetical protein